MTHNVIAEDAGVRLDVFLAKMLPELTRSAVQLRLEEGQVTLAEGVKITGFLVKNGDMVKEGDPLATVDTVSVMTTREATLKVG